MKIIGHVVGAFMVVCKPDDREEAWITSVQGDGSVPVFFREEEAQERADAINAARPASNAGMEYHVCRVALCSSARAPRMWGGG